MSSILLEYLQQSPQLVARTKLYVEQYTEHVQSISKGIIETRPVHVQESQTFENTFLSQLLEDLDAEQQYHQNGGKLSFSGSLRIIDMFDA